MKGLWLRGGVYWLAATIPGFGRVRASLETEDAAEAIQQAKLRRAFPSRYFGAESAGSAIEEYLEMRRRGGISQAWLDHCRMVLQSLKPAAPGGKIEAITGAAAEKWWNELLKKNKPATAAQYLRHVVAFYAWAIKTNRLKTVSPFDGIVAPKARPVPRRSFLQPAEALRVLDECKDEDLKFALYCALHCGLRKGEIIAARPRWFDLDAGLLHVMNETDWLTKDRDNRTVPISDEFNAFLATYGLRKPYMFRPDVRPKVTNRTWRYRTDFVKAFEGHMKRLGIEGITFHDLRRTFASLHVSRGTPIYHVAKWLGDDIAIVEKTYAHLLPNDPRINDPWTAARKAPPDGGAPSKQ